MTKKVPWSHGNCLGYPLFLFCDKKVPWVLLENYKMHPPTLWVLLGMCSIKKVPAPPANFVTFQILKWTFDRFHYLYSITYQLSCQNKWANKTKVFLFKTPQTQPRKLVFGQYRPIFFHCRPTFWSVEKCYSIMYLSD